MDSVLSVPGSTQYRLSGRPGLGWVMLPPAGLLCGAVLGWLYGVINVWNPFLYFQALATLLGAGALGWLIDQLAGVAKCRNRLAVHLAGVLCGIAFFYFGWASFECMLASRFAAASTGTLNLAADPGLMWTIATNIASTGWFTLGSSSSSSVSGILLWLIWVIEAGILLGGPVVVAHGIFSKRVFCEDCSAWIPRKKGIHRIAIAVETEEMARNCDLEKLTEAPLHMSVSSAGSYFRVDHSLCEQCQNTGTCSVMKVDVTRDEKGKESVSETNASGLIVLTPEKARQLGHLVARIRERAKEIREERKSEAQEALKAKQAKAAARKREEKA